MVQVHAVLVFSMTGGGHGPVLLEADLRPSYQATDEQGVELPSYSHYKSDQRTRTQQRMGFNW